MRWFQSRQNTNDVGEMAQAVSQDQPESKTNIEELQARVQQLYDIPIFEFTRENRDELQALGQQAEAMGYERAEDDSLYAIRYRKRAHDNEHA